MTMKYMVLYLILSYIFIHVYFHIYVEREREEKNIPDVYEHMAGMAFGHSRMIRSRIDMPSNAFIVARPELQLEDFLGEW